MWKFVFGLFMLIVPSAIQQANAQNFQLNKDYVDYLDGIVRNRDHAWFRFEPSIIEATSYKVDANYEGLVADGKWKGHTSNKANDHDNWELDVRAGFGNAYGYGDFEATASTYTFSHYILEKVRPPRLPNVLLGRNIDLDATNGKMNQGAAKANASIEIAEDRSYFTKSKFGPLEPLDILVVDLGIIYRANIPKVEEKLMSHDIVIKVQDALGEWHDAQFFNVTATRPYFGRYDVQYFENRLRVLATSKFRVPVGDMANPADLQDQGVRVKVIFRDANPIELDLVGWRCVVAGNDSSGSSNDGIISQFSRPGISTTINQGLSILDRYLQE